MWLCLWTNRGKTIYKENTREYEKKERKFFICFLVAFLVESVFSFFFFLLSYSKACFLVFLLSCFLL